MKENDFLWVLLSSFIVSTLILYFSPDLWGWAIINIIAFIYYLISIKEYNWILTWSIPFILIYIFSKNIFFILLESTLLFIIFLIRGKKNVFNNIW
ncbi:MAG: hypothetical protein JHC29_04810 [Thermoplasmata archaeon]|jgi:hypothetical protein|nr:hypothetical protein [Thermoplasmata archaeon]MVT13138.1 hypothetical protein [Euryarchaeota archaeon]